ncbi:MAG: arylesterase [Bdellovibrionales bacterium]
MVGLIMKMILLLLISLIPLAQSPQNLVIIGDSLTEGYGVSFEQSYPYLLEQKLKKSGKNWKVTNHGISGSTTASAPARVRWIMKNPPDLVVLALGANDGLRGFKPEATEKNLNEAIQLLKQKNIKVLLAAMKMPPNYKGGSFAQKFEDLYPALAKKNHVPLIPFILEGVAGRPDMNQKDGIHPNVKGHEVIAETLFKSISGHL